MNVRPSWVEVIELPMPVTLGVVNVYLVRGPSGIGLIDTGMNDASARATLLEALSARGVAPRDVTTVLCTHHHPDHAGLAWFFLEQGADVVMSQEDAEALSLFHAHPERDVQQASFYGKHEVPSEFVEKVSKTFPFLRTLSRPVQPSRLVADGDVVDVGGVELHVLATPGHTPGHICLMHERERLVFTGDCVLAGDATHVSMRPEAQTLDPLGCFIESLQRLAGLEGAWALCGHGVAVEDLPARARLLVRHHESRLAQIRNVLSDEPMTAYEISTRVMGPRNRVFARWLALSQTLGYLVHLVGTGIACEVAVDGHTRYVKSR